MNFALKNILLIVFIAFFNAIYPQKNIELLERASEKADSGFYHEAVKLCNEFIKLNPKYIYAYYNRALSLEQIGDTLGAINDYKKYLSKKWFDSDAHINIAFLYFFSGNDAYKKHMNKAVLYSRRDSYYRVNRGILYYNAGEEKSALKDFDWVIKDLANRAYFSIGEIGDEGSFINENCFSAYYFKALINYEKTNYKDALENMNEAMKFKEDNADAFYLRAYINLELENTEDACFDFTQAAHYGKEDAYVDMAQYCF